MNRGIRGATTVENDSEQEIVSAAEALIREIADINNLQPEMVVNVFISMTTDLKAAFPAKALRKLKGWDMVPVMCMQEIDVHGSLPKCIRIMLTAETELKQDEIKHIYQNKAVCLRPDLAAKKQ
ncbi:chorismate mutase [Metabacillus sp. RGM 3146]|uniref:chorismate mutase n=1 Tax=Metabacillus sp. RGM 3146 TaxID=3401092 RepID=UPI003B9957A4